MSKLAHITNFVQLTATVGTAGQPKADEFANVAAAGYDVVINLAMVDSEHALSNEGTLVTSLGMTYINLPVNFKTPRPADVARFIRLMRGLEDQTSVSNIFVHCVVNFRVSAFMYHYLKLEKGYSDAAARSPMFEKWAPYMDEVWANLLSWTREDIFG